MTAPLVIGAARSDRAVGTDKDLELAYRTVLSKPAGSPGDLCSQPALSDDPFPFATKMGGCGKRLGSFVPAAGGHQ